MCLNKGKQIIIGLLKAFTLLMGIINFQKEVAVTRLYQRVKGHRSFFFNWAFFFKQKSLDTNILKKVLWEMLT